MDTRRHLACCSCAVWSHTRALLCWHAALVLHDSRLYVTFFLPAAQQARADELLDKYRLSAVDRQRLRLVYVDLSLAVNASGRFNGPLAGVAEVVLEHFYEQLMNGESVDGNEALPGPAGLSCDSFAHHVVDIARERKYAGQTFLSGACDPGAIFLAHWDMQHAIDSPGRPALFERPGYRSRWSYEALCSTPSRHWPVDVIFDFVKEQHFSRKSGHRFLMAFSRDLLPSHNALLRSEKPFDEKLFLMGPQLAPPDWLLAPHFPDDPLFRWLNQQQLHSVVFISFGAEHFPTASPWQLETLLDALLAAGLPFILSLAARAVTLMETERIMSIKRQIEESGNQYVAWLDQPMLLRHPAISAAFLHGGLPCIVSPQLADQSSNAATVAIDLNAGWEIWETRDRLVGRVIASRPGFQVQATPTALRAELDGIFTELKGEVGLWKRLNAQRVGGMLRHEHATKSKSYMDEFLRLCWPSEDKDDLIETEATADR